MKVAQRQDHAGLQVVSAGPCKTAFGSVASRALSLMMVITHFNWHTSTKSANLYVTGTIGFWWSFHTYLCWLRFLSANAANTPLALVVVIT